jgi:hypothetical protein
VKIIDSFSGEYEFLSNFFVEKNGMTLEHRFQAAKAKTKHDRIFILSQKTPGKAKRAGRHIDIRKDWEVIRLLVMEQLVRTKFTDVQLFANLNETYPALLIEGNNWGDQFWGMTKNPSTDDWEGENNLGKILMKIREENMKLVSKEEYARLVNK